MNLLVRLIKMYSQVIQLLCHHQIHSCIQDRLRTGRVACEKYIDSTQTPALTANNAATPPPFALQNFDPSCAKKRLHSIVPDGNVFCRLDGGFLYELSPNISQGRHPRFPTDDPLPYPHIPLGNNGSPRLHRSSNNHISAGLHRESRAYIALYVNISTELQISRRKPHISVHPENLYHPDLFPPIFQHAVSLGIKLYYAPFCNLFHHISAGLQLNILAVFRRTDLGLHLSPCLPSCRRCSFGYQLFGLHIRGKIYFFEINRAIFPFHTGVTLGVHQYFNLPVIPGCRSLPFCKQPGRSVMTTRSKLRDKGANRFFIYALLDSQCIEQGSNHFHGKLSWTFVQNTAANLNGQWVHPEWRQDA